MNKDKKNIVWLASYPKSGNTWVRIFFANLLSNDSEPISINSLNEFPSAASITLIEDALGICISDFTESEILNLRPVAYREISRNSDKLIFLKVHDQFTTCPKGKILFPREITKAVIYIVRNPLDVLVSYAYHNNIAMVEMAGIIINESRSLCGNYKKSYTQCKQSINSWSNHVNSWTDNKILPTLVVRYEDLANNSYDCFSKMVDFLKLKKDRNQIIQAIKYSSFKSLRQQEQQFGFNERPINAERFFREGNSGSWKNELNDKIKNQIIQAFQPELIKYNYL